ncbi:MAG TPA: hypothetical protein VMY17_01585, partial [Thermoplasmata archaeon]|nr:hypothetical protein [Thermoplasmata archaeon]
MSDIAISKTRSALGRVFLGKSIMERITEPRKPRSVIADLFRDGMRDRKRVRAPVSLQLCYELADKSPLLRMVHWAIVRECTRK